jgi:SAM-dependent methyltransferase
MGRLSGKCRLKVGRKNMNIWPPIDFELQKAKQMGLLRGKVLNAGAGWRDLSHLVEGTLINQDLKYENETRTNINIYSDLENIPVDNDTFDTILCIAVLEHVKNPNEIVEEFHRVTKSGGYVVASIPFLQPEHKVPTDYQRYTKDGIQYLFTRFGFEIVECYSIFNVYFTFYWFIADLAKITPQPYKKLLTAIGLRVTYFLATRSNTHSDILASAFQVIARKT